MALMTNYKCLTLVQFRSHIVDNKAERRISKRAIKENKARQIFRKTNISYPLIRIRTCTDQGVRNVFWKIWRALSSRNTRFKIRSFALLPIIKLIFHEMGLFLYPLKKSENNPEIF